MPRAREVSKECVVKQRSARACWLIAGSQREVSPRGAIFPDNRRGKIPTMSREMKEALESCTEALNPVSVFWWLAAAPFVAVIPGLVVFVAVTGIYPRLNHNQTTRECLVFFPSCWFVAMLVYAVTKDSCARAFFEWRMKHARTQQLLDNYRMYSDDATKQLVGDTLASSLSDPGSGPASGP